VPVDDQKATRKLGRLASARAWLADSSVMSFAASLARSRPAGAVSSCCHSAAMKIKKA
jgi:hypothetical protein